MTPAEFFKHEIATKAFMESLDIVYMESPDQENKFTPKHTRYDCVISRPGTNYVLEFEFQCGIGSRPNVEDCMYCLAVDAITVESAKSYAPIDIMQYLYDEMGYRDFREMRKVAFDLLRNSQKMRAFKPHSITFEDIVDYCER